MASFPESIKVRPPTMNDVSAVLSLMLARDQAEYGEANMTEEHIRNFWQASDFNMDTDAWIVTTQNEQIIGYASVWHMQHVQVYTYFTALSEYDHLYIKWRGKGLGLALLRHSFAEFYRRGTHVVKLMVDTQNPWGATRLYEHVGMHVTQLYHQYAKELRPGKELNSLTD